MAKETKGRKKSPPNRRKGPADGSAADAADELLRETLAREFIGVCLAALKTYGLKEERLRELAIEAPAEQHDESLTWEPEAIPRRGPLIHDLRELDLQVPLQYTNYR